MEKKFKRGDTVICVNRKDAWNLRAGTVYQVVAVHPSWDGISVRAFPQDNAQVYSSMRFEKYNGEFQFPI